MAQRKLELEVVLVEVVLVEVVLVLAQWREADAVSEREQRDVRVRVKSLDAVSTF